MNDQLEQARLMRCRHDWPVYHLKHLARLTGGGTPAKENGAFWEGGDVPWISPKDMKRRVITSAEDYITEDAVDGSATSFVDAGSPLMVVRSGILRHTLPVAIAGRRLTLNQDMKAFNLSSRLNPMFFVYWVEGQSSDLLLEWRQFGATVESIDTGRLLNGRVALPDLPTQKAIADFLDRETARIDQLIEKKQRMVEVLGEKRQVVINRAVTKGLDPDVPMKDSGAEWLGENPVHWEITRLKRLAAMQAGTSITSDDIESEGDYPVFGGNGVRGFTSSYTHDGEFPLIGRQGALCGCVNFATGQFWASEHAVVCTPNAKVCSRWLAQLLQAMSLNRYSQSAAQPGLSVEAIGLIAAPKLSYAEQRGIVAFLDRETANIDALVAKVGATRDRLREFRSALITASVTGEIDVSTWGKQRTIDRRFDRIEEAASA